MKKRTLITLALVFGLINFGFTQDGHHHDENDAIVLNDGQKWVVVEHMMAHIRNMERDIVDFNGKKIDDFNVLAKKLQTNIGLLTSNCTMSGQAHDELHKWLVPYIGLVGEFEEVKTIQSAMDHYTELQDTFVEFNKFFK